MKGKMRMLSRITRILNVTVVCCIVFVLAFMAISVNCDEEPISKTMFIKPDKIILNSNSDVNDVVAQFPIVGGCPPDGNDFDAELRLFKAGTDLGSISDDDLISYHYCATDDVLQVRFDRQAVQDLVEDLVGGEISVYTAVVTFEILPILPDFPDGISIVGEDDSVEMVKPGKSGK